MLKFKKQSGLSLSDTELNSATATPHAGVIQQKCEALPG